MPKQASTRRTSWRRPSQPWVKRQSEAGAHRDELYFIICGQRPDWGYVDQPPLIPLLASLMHALFPDSLTTFRLIPALAHAGTVALTAETARKLGGGNWAQLLAGMAA